MTNSNPETATTKLTPEQEAKRDAKDIHTSLNRDNASTAYELMLKEVSSAKKEYKPASKELKTYTDTLATELTNSKDIVELSPIWGARAFDKLAITNSTGNRSETIGARDISPYANGALPTDNLTKAYASSLRNQIKDQPVTREQLTAMESSQQENRIKSGSTDFEKSQTEGYAKLLEGKTSTGKSLFQLADVAGKGTHPENINGKVSKQDIDALIKAGEEGFTSLKASEIASLKYLSDNWDTKPEVQNLRQTKDSNGVISTGDFITNDSLTLAKSSQRENAKAAAEETGIDTNDQQRSFSIASADLLLNHKTDSGKSLLDAADFYGGNGNTDKLVGKQDIDALLSASKNGLVKLSEADKAALTKLSEGWDSEKVIALRKQQTVDEYGGPVTGIGDYISPDSLKLASGETAAAEQKHNAEQSKKMDEISVNTRTEAAEIAKNLRELKFGKNDLFTAADLYGATKDGEVNKDAVDNKIDDGDLKKLASVLLVSNGADSPEYKLVNQLIQDWNKPAAKALRGGQDYITPETMRAVQLN